MPRLLGDQDRPAAQHGDEGAWVVCIRASAPHPRSPGQPCCRLPDIEEDDELRMSGRRLLLLTGHKRMKGNFMKARALDIRQLDAGPLDADTHRKVALPGVHRPACPLQAGAGVSGTQLLLTFVASSAPTRKQLDTNASKAFVARSSIRSSDLCFPSRIGNSELDSPHLVRLSHNVRVRRARALAGIKEAPPSSPGGGYAAQDLPCDVLFH